MIRTHRRHKAIAFMLGIAMLAGGTILTPKLEAEPHEASWRLYLANRDQDHMEQEIKAWRAAPEGVHPRLLAWADLIDFVKSVPDLRTKAEIVNGWCNALMTYNDDKTNPATNPTSVHQPIWQSPPSYRHNGFYQTPIDSLVNGKGICVDDAMLKYETLRLAGFPAADIEPVCGTVIIINAAGHKASGGHMVTFVRIDGKTYVMNDVHYQDTGEATAGLGGISEHFCKIAALDALLPIGNHEALLEDDGGRGKTIEYRPGDVLREGGEAVPAGTNGETIAALPGQGHGDCREANKAAETARVIDDFRQLFASGGNQSRLSALIDRAYALNVRGGFSPGAPTRAAASKAGSQSSRHSMSPHLD